MQESLNLLQTFNPSQSNPELLELTLTGRKHLVDRLEELVLESAKSGNKHQRLMIGPRGSGKTHGLKVLHNRIIKRQELKDKLEIAYLCEDEYGVATFLDFLIRIFFAFFRWYPQRADYLRDEIEKLKKVPAIDQEKIATQLLLNYIKGKTLLVIVENIGDIFHQTNGFGKKGQQKLRDLIQQHPYFTIIASNQALFEDIQKEDMPFHNFFKVIHLRKLDFEETILFLKTIAQSEGKSEIVNLLDEPDGRGRIQAIHDFTNGNHRLLVTFYQFLSADFINNLSEIFVKTINDLTPYYQSMMEKLSAQQQKIVQYMSQQRRPCNVKTIAENCFSTHNIISKQMTNLARLKYVDAISSGRETFYELSKPLFRICYEIKDNRGGPIKLFVDFLGNLYSAEELKKRFMQYHLLTFYSDKRTSLVFQKEEFYYKEALEKYFPSQVVELNKFEEVDQNLQVKAFIEGLEETRAYPEILDFTSKIEQKDQFLLLTEAKAYGKKGDFDKQIEAAKSVLKENKNDVEASLMVAEALQQKTNFLESDRYFRRVLQIESKNIKALIGLGQNLLKQENYDKAEHYFLKVIEIDKNNSFAVMNCGIVLSYQNRNHQAYKYFKKFTEQAPSLPLAWILLGDTQEELGRIEDAKASYFKVLELDEKNIAALRALGNLLGEHGEYQLSHRYLQKLTELAPDYSEGWELLGRSQWALEKTEQAKKSYLKAIKLDNQKINAIYALGKLFSDQDDHQKAEKYFEKLTMLIPDYAQGWWLLGRTQQKLGKVEKAKTTYLRLLEIDQNNLDAIYSLGILFGEKGSYNEACDYFQRFIVINPNESPIWTILGIAQTQINKIDDAKASLMKAIELNRENVIAIRALGRVFLTQKDDKKANAQFRKLTRINPSDSEAWSLLGESQQMSGKFEEAIRSYKKALKLDGKNPHTLFSLGNLFSIQRDYEQAHDYFQKYTTLEPLDPAGWIQLGYSEEYLNKLEKAKATYLNALKLDKENLVAVDALGRVHGKLGYHNEAFKYYKKLTELVPDDSYAWAMLGLALESLKKMDDAKASYLKSLTLDDKNIFALEFSGMLYCERGEFRQAYDSFKKLTDFNPDYAQGWSLLGLTQSNLGDIEEAKNSLLKALQLDANNVNANYSLGMLFGEIQRDDKEAQNYFKKLTELQPNYARAWVLLGSSEFNLQNFREAEKCALRALELDHDQLDAQHLLSRVLLKQGRLEKASTFINKVLSKTPNNASFLHTKGEIYRQRRRFKESISAYQKAITKNPNALWSYLGIVSSKLGLDETSEAVSNLKTALEIAKKQNIDDELFEAFEENLTAAFIHASQKNVTHYLKEAVPLMAKYDYEAQLYQSMSLAIFAILKRHEEIDVKRFGSIENLLEEEFKDNDALIVPLKFLNIGIRHLKKKEKNVLMDLTKEERATFKRFVLEQNI